MESSSGTVLCGISGDDHVVCEDLELVAAAKGGSNTAFEKLQSRYSRRLYRRIRSITGSHEDAEDALQDTFLRAYLALNSFEGRSQFSTWLTRIAINSALMILRKRHRRVEVSFEPLPDSGELSQTVDVRDTSLNPEQHYDLRQRSYSALSAISRLKANLRTPMTTWIEQECSMNEVALTLGLSLAAVKSRLCRARKQVSRSAAFRERIPNAGQISESKCQCVIPGFQNRELPCPSCD